jgi:hypothetical protein
MNKTDRFVKTYGLGALERTFENMANSDKRKIMIPALKRAVSSTVDMARTNAPVGKTGNLQKSVGTVALQNEMAILVGARTGHGFKGYHGHLLNDGTVDRFRKNGGATGKMGVTKPYFHWFTKAAEATEKQAVDSIANEWHKGVARMIIRSNKED